MLEERLGLLVAQLPSLDVGVAAEQANSHTPFVICSFTGSNVLLGIHEPPAIGWPNQPNHGVASTYVCLGWAGWQVYDGCASRAT